MPVKSGYPATIVVRPDDPHKFAEDRKVTQHWAATAGGRRKAWEEGVATAKAHIVTSERGLKHLLNAIAELGLNENLKRRLAEEEWVKS